MAASNICEIEKLVELFNFSRNEEEEEKEVEHDVLDTAITKNSKMQTKPIKKNPYAKIESPVSETHSNDPDTITDEKIEKFYLSNENTPTNMVSSWKKTPKWNISYKQSVTASDVFLGMGFKTPSTSSCENIVIKIELPEEHRQNIDLKIEEKKIILISSKYALDLKLPHPVNPKLGLAEFDSDKNLLNVILVMNRELDLLNF